MPLSPSQRVTLIKEISGRLSMEDYPLIDVTLKTFRQPVATEWHGSKDSYVIAMIEEATDQALIDLAEHVGFRFEKLEASPPGIEPSFWQKGMLRVFLSHLAAHRKFSGALQHCLLEHGISCFVAHNDIEPTAEWLTEIETALATCDALVALLHPNFHKSNWTDQEIGYVMGRGLPVFAVQFGEPPYGFIGRFQAFDGNGKELDKLARELFDAYRKNKQTQPRMAEVLVSLFEGSESFAESKRIIGLLEQMEVWDPSFATRIRTAVKNNSQISNSWGVPERAEVLAEKWNIG